MRLPAARWLSVYVQVCVFIIIYLIIYYVFIQGSDACVHLNVKMNLEETKVNLNIKSVDLRSKSNSNNDNLVTF